MITTLHILFITGASHHGNLRNYNHFQRVYCLSRELPMTIIGTKGADFSLSAASNTRIVRSRFSGKFALILLSLYWLISGRKAMGGTASDVVLLTEPSIVNIVGPLYKWFWRCKWVVDVWDIPIRTVTVKIRLIQWRCKLERYWLRWCFRWADLFLLVLHPDLEFSFYRVPPRKIARFFNAIFLDENLPGDLFIEPRGQEVFQIIYVRSTYTPIMGLDILAAAFEQLCLQRPNCRLVIVGRLPHDTLQQVDSLRGRSDVQFIEVIPHNELQSLIAESHAMVIPFRDVPDLAQTIPIKAIEGFLNGATLVVPAIVGLSELVHNEENGLTYAPDNSLALMASLSRLYDDDELRIRLAKNAYSRISDFDCVKKNMRIIDLIKRLSLQRTTR